jgi:hypothetical protein
MNLSLHAAEVDVSESITVSKPFEGIARRGDRHSFAAHKTRTDRDEESSYLQLRNFHSLYRHRDGKMLKLSDFSRSRGDASSSHATAETRVSR